MEERFRLYDAEGKCLARDNLLIAFFGKRPFADMVDGAAHCVRRYLDIVPDNLLKWSIIGVTAGTYKPLTNKDLARCRSMLTVGIAKQKDIHFRLLGPEIYAPDYGLIVDGNRIPRKQGFADPTNAIEMRFPREFLSTNGEDTFVATVMDLFDKLPCDSGYAAVSLCFGNDSRFDKAGAYIAPLALRSHGFDVPNTLFTATVLGNRCRGARWLTMLDTALIDELGGSDSLREKLLDGVEVINGAHGILLRAGRTPEIGDINRNQTTRLVASVAHAIKAVTYFRDNGLLPLFGNDPERRDRWERRFFID